MSGLSNVAGRVAVRLSLVGQAIALALLAACGGGDTASGEDQTSSDYVSTGSVPDESALAVGPGTWSQIAVESASFSFAGTRSVRYGSGTSWIERDLTDGGVCSNNFFGLDPLPNVAKACQIFTPTAPPPGVGSWSRVAVQGAFFTVSGSQRVRYGRNKSWVERTVTGTARCTNVFFRSDPLPGATKVCQVFNEPAPAPAPPPAPGTPATLAVETGAYATNPSIVLSRDGLTVVSFGDASNPNCLAHRGIYSDPIFNHPEFGSVACHKRAVRANGAVRQGQFRYFEGLRLIPAGNYAFGFAVRNSAIDPLCCYDGKYGENAPPYPLTTPSMSINTIGGVFVNLVGRYGFSDAERAMTLYYGIAIDYTGSNPVAYTVTQSATGLMQVARYTTSGFNGQDAVPMMYGDVGIGASPNVATLNFGQQGYYYSATELRSRMRQLMLGSGLSSAEANTKLNQFMTGVTR